MIDKICNKYVDFSKIVGLELIDTGNNYLYIEVNIQLLEKPLNITFEDVNGFKNNIEKIKQEFEKALEKWKNLNDFDESDD